MKDKSVLFRVWEGTFVSDYMRSAIRASNLVRWLIAEVIQITLDLVVDLTRHSPILVLNFKIVDSRSVGFKTSKNALKGNKIFTYFKLLFEIAAENSLVLCREIGKLVGLQNTCQSSEPPTLV